MSADNFSIMSARLFADAEKMPGPDDTKPVTILHLTDMHLHATIESRMRGVRTHETFMAVLESAEQSQSWKPDLLVVTGDIVQDESSAGYRRFRSILERYQLPVLCTPGNHDDPILMQRILNEPPFQTGGEALFGQWAIIVLSTFLAGDDAGQLGPERLHTLQQRLEAFASLHVLICLHHHPMPMGSRWLDGVALRDSEAFFDITDRYKNIRGVVTGHVHQESDQMRNGVRYLSTPSTCAQFLPRSEFFVLDKLPPGMRWLELHGDGRINTHVQWLEEPR